MSRARLAPKSLLLSGLALASVTSPMAVSDAPAEGELPRVLQAVMIRGLEARSAALILSGQEAGELDVSFIAVPLARESGIIRLTLVVDLAGESLIEAVKEDTLFTEIYAFALDGSGGVTEFLGQGFALSLPEQTPVLARRGVRFLGTLELPPGDYSVRVLVLQRQTGRFGLRKAHLGLPESQGESPARFWTAVFPETEQEWILVRESAEQEAAESGLPLPRGDPPWLPSSRGIVERETLFLHLVGWGIPTRVGARVLDPRGNPVRELVLSGPSASPLQTGAVEIVPTTLNTAGLAAGDYLLEVDGSDGERESTTSVPFTVLEPTIDVVLPGSDPGAQPSSRRRTAWRDLTVRYLESLSQLPEAKPLAARSSVMKLEEAAIQSGRSDAKDRLAEALYGVASRLASSETESLLPIVQLHVEIFRDYRQEQRFVLAGHARRMALLLAEVYGDHSSAEDAEQLVACALSSLAGYLQEVGATLEAKEIFERALRARGNHPAALLGLGVIHEALGDYAEATAFLRRFLQLRPDDREAGLRLAVNLRRLGEKREAESLLREGLAGDHRDWIAALFHQELADLLARENRADDAVRLLRQAIDSWPHLERFYIQLAAVLDSSERTLGARTVLDRLDAAPGRAADSPRLRYGLWSPSVVEPDRRYLADAVKARLPDLEEALLLLRSPGAQDRRSRTRSTSAGDTG